MKFDITFHTPFRVATGAASDGLDATVDLDNPLPASSLKGLIRAQAAHSLGIQEPILEEVFGSARRQSSWWWSDAHLTDAPLRTRSRVSIDPITHTATHTAFFTAGELWPSGGIFEVEPLTVIADDRRAIHEVILTAAARMVTALGSDRRRGLGWVSITSSRAWNCDDTLLLQSLRSPHA